MNHRLVGAVLWICVGCALLTVVLLRGSGRRESGQPDDGKHADGKHADETTTVTIPTPAMTLSDFELTNTQGEPVRKEDITGQPTVFSFVFSRCISTCRPITMEMKKLHDKLGDTDTRFVSVTVDPDYDTVKQFGEFADIYAPEYDRWQFLTGSKEAIYNMIRGGFQLQVKEMFGADAKPGFEVLHTNRVVLVNPDGVPVKSYLILNDADRADLTRVLQGKKEFPQPPSGNEAITIQRDGESETLEDTKRTVRKE